ncbi:nucleotide exchange factor GrpE [Crenobacter cavernae]|uniref:Protein GrpE n=1 Tax=Crenobacter cavernae TaxID=2290923 RepID=A0A345Y6L2_9NEIS|nr:nucleotide exchange factor GrpE [Crenobacter cavernae]AXK39564.1 nucleotide exchange factor GrpE [Crenobacter cavernae]
MQENTNPIDELQKAAEAETLAEPTNAPEGDDRVAQLEAEVAELKDQFLRTRAEMDNLRRRSAEEVMNAQKYAINKFAQELFSVKDSLEMALLDQSGQFDALKFGVDLTLKQLASAFEKAQIVELNPVGEKLDPHKHQAISAEASDAEANTVVRVMQKGYQVADRVLRPAMVVVSKGQE